MVHPSVAAEGGEEEPAVETIAVNNVAYTRAQLEEDYQIAVRRYAINPMTKRMESIAGLGVSVIEGTVTQASGSRLIVATSDGGHAALITVSSRSGKPSETPVAFVVKDVGTYSWRDPSGDRKRIPQYRNYTMTRSEFVHYLRRGYPFGGLKHVKNNVRRGLNPTQSGNVAGRESGFQRGKPGSLKPRENSGFKRRTTIIK